MKRQNCGIENGLTLSTTVQYSFQNEPQTEIGGIVFEILGNKLDAAFAEAEFGQFF